MNHSSGKGVDGQRREGRGAERPPRTAVRVPLWWRVVSGVRDAMQFHQLWPMLRQSRELWHAVRDALLFNLIWMAVSFCKSCVISKWIRMLVGQEQEWILDWVFLLTWNVPIYILLICLSIFWHNTIVMEACELMNRRPYRQLDPMQQLLQSSFKLADEVYRILVVGIFWLCAKLVQHVLGHMGLASVGTVVYFISNSWMAAFYAMEYVWTTLGWSLKERIHFFEWRWGYLFGFGLPITITTFSRPFMTGVALYAFLFPLVLMLAVKATPKDHKDHQRLRLFAPGMAASHQVVSKCLGLLGW